jgi:hypothetical protein
LPCVKSSALTSLLGGVIDVVANASTGLVVQPDPMNAAPRNAHAMNMLARIAPAPPCRPVFRALV